MWDWVRVEVLLGFKLNNEKEKLNMMRAVKAVAL